MDTNRQKLPAFLAKIKTSAKVRKALIPHARNWKVLHRFINDDASQVTSSDLAVMMIMEFRRDRGPRMHMLERMVGRYNVLRRDEEWNQLVDCYNTYDEEMRH